MDTIVLDDPCVLFALRRESQFFRREFRPYQSFPGAPCPAQFCGPPWLNVLLLETGIGASAVEPVMDWLLSAPKLNDLPYRPKVVVFAGFAGALDPSLRVGDVLLASEVVDLGGTPWATTWPGELPAGEWKPPLHRGRLLTMPSLVATPNEKRELAERYQARAVDMESAGFARRCTQAGIPFGCLRVVSDDAATSMSPALAGLLVTGRVSPGRLFFALLRNPFLLIELMRLGRDTRLASERLGRALGELLTLTLPWLEGETFSKRGI